MKIAILSDTHDNVARLRQALALTADCEQILHCGDLCSPFMLKILGDTAHGRPVHVVAGNNDGDFRLLSQVAAQYPEVQLHGPFAQLELGGSRIGMVHYPELARPLAASRMFDLVCYGHDHKALVEKVGECLLLNPGELLGLFGRASLAVFDTKSREAAILNVD